MEAIDFDSRAPHHSTTISDVSSSLLMLSSAMIIKREEADELSTCSRVYASKTEQNASMQKNT